MMYNTLQNKIERLEIRQDHVAELYVSTKDKYLETIANLRKMEEEQHNKDLIIIEIKTKLT